ncbi:hypothetical protein [Embleya sp. NPDC050493]|uniref:hypothetical protein n=1 Tax=Embleya sp. NPDC050493 TaxID=3363989 RepID=UPI0037A5BA19
MTITLERTVPARPAEPASARPRIVCLCGSTRFMAEIAKENERLTLAGAVVLAPSVDMKTPSPLWADPARAADIKTGLDHLHRAKIAMADEIVVVCPGGYYGDSTRIEIGYARTLGKPVTFRREGRTATGPGRSAPVFVEDFTAMLSDVRPHCGDDPMLPLTHGVRLEATGDRLYAVASGRYTLAATVRATPGIGTWDLHLTRAVVHTLTTLAHSTGSPDARLEVGPSGLGVTVHIGPHRYVIDRHYAGDYPNWRPLVAEALAAGPALDGEIVLYAEELARFSRGPEFTGYTPLTVWGRDPRKPLAITRGPDHVGLITTTRREYGAALDEIRDTWQHTLTDTRTRR